MDDRREKKEPLLLDSPTHTHAHKKPTHTLLIFTETPSPRFPHSAAKTSAHALGFTGTIFSSNFRCAEFATKRLLGLLMLGLIGANYIIKVAGAKLKTHSCASGLSCPLQARGVFKHKKQAFYLGSWRLAGRGSGEL